MAISCSQFIGMGYIYTIYARRLGSIATRRTAQVHTPITQISAHNSEMVEGH